MRSARFPLRLVLILLLLNEIAGCNFSGHPSDQVLEQKLKQNQRDFEHIVAMLSEDRDIVRLDSDYVFLTEHSSRTIPEERLNEYRRIFKKLDLKGGFHRDRNEAMRFIASTGMGFIPSSEKSYVYCRDALSPLVNSLDEVIGKDRGDQQPIYKKLDGNWYLYYESW